MKRRSFLRTSSLALAGTGGIRLATPSIVQGKGTGHLTLTLNAFSFNRPLRDGEMSLDELFQFASQVGFPAVDLTAYYIPGYPNVPGDEVLYQIKKSAFRSGLSLSGTGIRNDFTFRNAEKHQENIELTKAWIVAASKLGIPFVRLFDGKGTEAGPDRNQTLTQIIQAFEECAEFGAQHGVMVAFQNHHDYIKSTDEVLKVLESVKSEWFGLMLDVGSVLGDDPYDEIEKLIPYAISWQVKENVRWGSERKPTDFKRLMQIVNESSYTGYFPLETLGEGDPRKKVQKLHKQVVQYID
jgi:sugar phosphate isomerase/epimerase